METAPQMRRPLNLVAQGGSYLLVADLPKNSTSLAVQAEEAGVDAVLMNIDGEEGAYPAHYGSYDLHDTYINDVISTLKVPCGIRIGGGRVLSEDYWERILSSQFSFVEMFAHQMPLFVLADTRIGKIATIATGYILEQVKKISQMEGVEALDSATVPAQAKGTPFTLLDYATLDIIANLSTKPVLLRTQKLFSPADLSKVIGLGISGLVVDPCVLSGAEEVYKQELLKFKGSAAGTDARAGTSLGDRDLGEAYTLPLREAPS